MIYLPLTFAGALLCNCVPHLVAGLQGRPFPTPFARPPGVGNSPPPVNFAWGSANLLLGSSIALRWSRNAGRVPGGLALALGFLAAGGYLSSHFAKVRPDVAQRSVKASK